VDGGQAKRGAKAQKEADERANRVASRVLPRRVPRVGSGVGFADPPNTVPVTLHVKNESPTLVMVKVQCLVHVTITGPSGQFRDYHRTTLVQV